jgi:hypothetical protein
MGYDDIKHEIKKTSYPHVYRAVERKNVRVLAVVYPTR